MCETTQARCRVYEAEVAMRPDWRFSVAVCEADEDRLREDIARGRRIFSLGRVLLETCDRELAHRVADLHYAAI